MPTRNITLMVAVKGAPAAARQLGVVTNQMHRLGQESRRTSDTVRYVGQSFQSMGNIVQTTARRSSYVVAALGAVAIKTGISFNALMESQTVAFKSFLGGAKQADAYLKSLVDLASNTPFRLTDVIVGTRALLAFGMEAGQAKRTMEGLGNALAANPSAGPGGIPAQIEAATRALGQIQAAGVLHAQDLNQLTEANVLTLPQLTKRMGTTTKAFRKDMAMGKISSDKFFKALKDSWENDPMYKGAAEKQMKTFNGQLERTMDMMERFLGAVTKPLFEVLRKKILPATYEIMADFQAIFSAKDWTLGEKIEAAMRSVGTHTKGLKEDFSKWMQDNDFKRRLKWNFEQALAYALTGAGDVISAAAKSWWESFKAVDNKTKAIEAGAILTLFGITKSVAVMAGSTLWGWLRYGAGGKNKGGFPGGGGSSSVGTMHVTAGTVIVNQGTGGKTPPGGVVVPGGKNPPKPPKPKPKMGAFGRLTTAATIAMGAYAGIKSGSLRNGIDAMDPTGILGYFGLPTITSTLGQYSGTKGFGEMKRDLGLGGKHGNKFGADMAWLGRAGENVLNVGADYNWQRARPGTGIATGGPFGGPSMPWGSTVQGNQIAPWSVFGGGGPQFPKVSTDVPMSAGDQQLLARLSHPQGLVVNVQVDGKTIATASHNASRRAASSR